MVFPTLDQAVVIKLTTSEIFYILLNTMKCLDPVFYISSLEGMSVFNSFILIN